MNRPALQNERVVVLRMAFRAREVFGTFEKRALGDIIVLIRRMIKGLVHAFAFSVWPFSVISLPCFPFSRINKQMDKLICIDIDN